MTSRAAQVLHATLAVVSVVATFAAWPTGAAAQALFAESFDELERTEFGTGGPADLIAEGWIFRDQNTVEGSGPWRRGDTTLLEPRDGPGFLGGWTQQVSVGGAVSKWVILPELAGLAGGDVLHLFVNPGLGSDEPVAFEVRRSALGGTDTGSGPTDIGDFDELLWVADPLPRGGWLPIDVEVPGPGRLALRLRVDARSPWDASSYVGIDSLLVGEVADDGCNDPPIPVPGETVAWSAAGSPWAICADTPIPAGGRVEVEAGASVAFDPGVRLTLEGELALLGEAAAPVTFVGGGGTPWDPSGASVLVLGGVLDARHASFSVAVTATGGDVLLSDSELGAGSGLWIRERVAPLFARVDRTLVDGAPFEVELATVAVRGTTFLGVEPVFDRTYPLLEDVVVEGSPGLGLDLVKGDQPLLLDRLVVRDAAGSALGLRSLPLGNSVRLGPDVVLEGCAAPAELGGVGLTPDSTVPATGNDRAILRFDSQRGSPGPITWWDHGLPYVIENGLAGTGGLTLRPGVRVLLGPDARLRQAGHNFDPLLVRGTPSRPVIFSRLDPAEPWSHVSAVGDGTHLEHAILEGSIAGLSAPGGVMHVESTTFRDNELALHVSGLGVIRVGQSLFHDNAVAVETDPSLLSTTGGLRLDGAPNPNAFVGNGVAVRARNDQSPSALYNWWNAVNGPQSPLNPDGTGEIVEGGTLVTPFLSEAPDHADSPPRVELRDTFSWLPPGEPVVLQWSAEDDVGISSQRIVMSPQGNFDLPVVVAEDLDPDVRSFAWAVPDVGPQTSGARSFVRVVATDTAGREGWDEAAAIIPRADSPTPVTILTDFSDLPDLPDPFEPGALTDLCWETDPDGIAANGFEAHVFAGTLQHPVRRGTGGVGHCLIEPLRLPWMSTNVARVAVRSVGDCCNGETWTFSDCFSIRPDPRLGDEPPTADLLTPTDGTVVPAGATLPIRWSASDDEGVREHHVQASFNGGRTWHEIVSHLPGDVRSFDWSLPVDPPADSPAEPLSEFRVRVLVIDHRFQETATSCAGTSVTVEEPCAGTDDDGDGYAGGGDPDCPDALVDCNDSDGMSWATPGEAGLLFLLPSKEHLVWSAPTEPGGTAVSHDVLRSRDPSDFEAATTCLETDDASDVVAADAELPGLTPPRWSAFHYLVRARNGCIDRPTGSLGTRSDGTPRAGRACP